MSSYIADIAEAVKDALNAAVASSGLSADFTAERVWVPEKDYSAVTGLVVWVFPRANLLFSSASTRRAQATEVEINIVYAQRLDQLTDPETEAANAAVDAMQQLGEEIADLIADRDQRYDGFPCLRTEQDPIYDFDILRTHRVFVGLIRCFFMRS